MNLPALMSIGLVEAAFSQIKGRIVVLVMRNDDGARRFTLSQHAFASRYSL
jgi:hypothetical protein